MQLDVYVSRSDGVFVSRTPEEVNDLSVLQRKQGTNLREKLKNKNNNINNNNEVIVRSNLSQYVSQLLVRVCL